MSRMIRTLALAACAALLMPAVAFGVGGTTGRTATATPAPSQPASVAATVSGAKAVPSTLDIQLWPSEADGVNLVVSAEIPAEVKLPATVRLPIPAGFTLGWVGEVFGGAVANDIELPYVTENGSGGKVIVVTATKSHIVQYEGVLPSLATEGTRFNATLDWVQSAPSATQSWAVKMLASTGDVKTDPAYVGAAQVNAVGERLYTLPSTQLALGKSQKLTVSFVRGETTATPAPSGSTGSSTVLIVLFSLLGLAVVVLMVVAARSKRPAA